VGYRSSRNRPILSGSFDVIMCLTKNQTPQTNAVAAIRAEMVRLKGLNCGLHRKRSTKKNRSNRIDWWQASILFEPETGGLDYDSRLI